MPLGNNGVARYAIPDARRNFNALICAESACTTFTPLAVGRVIGACFAWNLVFL